MSKVKKPEPVVWVIYEPISKRHILSEVELKTKYLDDGTIAYSVSPVVFQSQSEAYANALAAESVRKALEQAASICDRFADRGMHPAECAGAIRALIPKQ